MSNKDKKKEQATIHEKGLGGGEQSAGAREPEFWQSGKFRDDEKEEDKKKEGEKK